MTYSKTLLRKDEYRDSGSLMRLTRALESSAGVTRAAAIMATPRNVEMLVRLGIAETSQLDGARPSDLAIVVVGATEEQVNAALGRVDAILGGGEKKGGGSITAKPRSIAAARETDPELSLAMISVPGPFAAREARRAIEEGLNVFLFSNGVALADEVSLKTLANERGLLVMGPDCGTAILDGVPLGFANKLPRGPVGVVGASGTGIQEVTSLLALHGVGTSHAIGTGGRDLSSDVGGISALKAIELLGKDAGTEVILLVSKPPSKLIADRVLEAARKTGKPCVACFLGAAEEEGVRGTLEGAVLDVLRVLGHGAVASELELPEDLRCAPWQKRLIGYFSGGSLGYESLVVMSRHLQTATNLHLDGALPADSGGHTVLDLGEDEYTRGRPHPMIDPSVRNQFIEDLKDDPTARVLLLDVVLGYGAHDDPAGSVAESISRARKGVSDRGGTLHVVASVTGTEEDPQVRSKQIATLEAAGVLVASSNAAAARAALKLVGSTKEQS